MKHIVNILSVLILVGIVSVTFAQEGEKVVVADEETPALSAVVETSNRNSALTTVAFVTVCVIALGALAFSAYVSNQQSNNVPISGALELVKTSLDAVSKATLPIALNMAKSTPNKLDDAAIEAVLLASGWTVTKSADGSLLSAEPPSLTETATITNAPSDILK